MRTKTTILSAAALAAGLISASAQVYSVNVVGYVNVALPEGFSIVANPLDFGGESVADNITNVFNANLPPNTKVYTYNGTEYSIATYTKDKAGTATNWSAIIDVSPGKGAWVKIPTGSGTRTNTFTGEVKQGSLVNTNIPAGGGYSLVGSLAPVGGAIDSALGYYGGANDKVYRWTNVAGVSGYQISTYTKEKSGASTNWTTVPQINVGEGFWLKSSAGQTWTRNFTVQ